MKIAITDANIFIDLIYAGLLAELFDAELELHTSEYVIDELNDNQQKVLHPFIQKKHLCTHHTDKLTLPDQIQGDKRLSPSDKSVFALALDLEAFILTGDGMLKKVSGVQQIEVHGILWLFDRFVEKKLVTKKKAGQQLKTLMEFNKRLPREECEKRIGKWG